MRPSRYSRTKTARTARDSPSSIVKRRRDQSHEQPSFLSCSMIVPPCFSFHCQMRASRPSRPTSWRVLRSSFQSAFSTTPCVATPAWSVPGTHSASRPRMRQKRMITSWSVLLSAWPMCRTPVTFGGGMTIV